MPLSAEQETRRPESTLTTRLRPRPSSAPPGPSQVRPGLGDPDAAHLTWSHSHMLKWVKIRLCYLSMTLSPLGTETTAEAGCLTTRGGSEVRVVS